MTAKKKGRPAKTPVEKLQDYAKANDIQFDSSMNETQLLMHIQIEMNSKLHPDEQMDIEPVKRREAIRNTKEDVIDVIRPIAEKVEGFKASFDEDCWTFKCGHKSESGTIHQPLDRIKQRAQFIAQRAVVPKKVKDGNITTILT